MKAALIGTITGLVVILWLSLSPLLGTSVAASLFHSYLTIVLGTTILFLTGLAATAGLNRYKKTHPKSSR